MENYYGIGATYVILNPGAGGVQVLPMAGQRGWIVSVNAGGSSGVAFVSSAAQVTCSLGAIIPTGTPQHIRGPATFFLAAQGSTAVVGLGMLMTQGYSLVGKF
jgi:hypothetical protein